MWIVRREGYTVKIKRVYASYERSKTTKYVGVEGEAPQDTEKDGLHMGASRKKKETKINTS